jgi:hypothetical protein
LLLALMLPAPSQAFTEDIPWFFPEASGAPAQLPHPNPDARPQPGMSPQDYFRHLCRLEAGEFVLRAVRDARGVFLLRPRFKPHPDVALAALAEDPYAWLVPGGAAGLEYASFEERFQRGPMRFDLGPDARLQVFVADSNFAFVEKPNLVYEDVPNAADLYDQPAYNYRMMLPHARRDADRAWIDGRRNPASRTQPYLRAVRGPDGALGPPQPVERLESRYALAWRGIERPGARAAGIFGAELLVIDLGAAEVIGVRRTFVMAAGGSTRDGVVACPSTNRRDASGRLRDVTRPPREFVFDVLNGPAVRTVE